MVPVNDPDRKICYCYTVTCRKLVNFARRTRPARASQMSDCLGAGTGCGWCIPFLMTIHEAVKAQTEPEIALSPEDYEALRKTYISTKQPKNEF
jgi:bacterioferritin-associated ferredoxin